MERAVIITGGTISDYHWTAGLIGPDDTVVCADSGYDHAVKMGIRPKVLLGDFDSIASLPENCEIIRYPVKKDSSDTELAAGWAVGQGFKELLFLGAIGSRMDHTLANIFLLAELLKSGARGEIIDEHNRIAVTETGLTLDEPPGAIVSLLPLSDCAGITTVGLEYPLQGTDMKPGRSLGVSNVVTARPASVSLTAGTLAVIIARD